MTGGAFYVVLHCFDDVGKNCVLDLNTGGTYTRVRPPECGLEMVAQMPPIQHCRVAKVPSDMVAQVRGCTRMRGFPGQDGLHGRLGLYKAGLCR